MGDFCKESIFEHTGVCAHTHTHTHTVTLPTVLYTAAEPSGPFFLSLSLSFDFKVKKQFQYHNFM